MSPGVNRLGLGTVQFGLNYGVSNVAGQVSETEVARILAVAQQTGIDTIDTAAQYGESEAVLGRALPMMNDFKIITKTAAIGSDRITNADIDLVKKTVARSLKRLEQNKIYGLMVHDADDLFKPGSELLTRALIGYREQGTVEKIGASVYNAEQLERLLERFTPEIIQLPGSVYDQRLIGSGLLKKLKSLGIEIHLRSVFLQGLLLMAPDHLDPYFDPIRSHVEAYHSTLKQAGLTSLQAALQFGLSIVEVDRIIVGACSALELTEIIEAAGTSLPAGFDFTRWAINDSAFVNPSEWQLNQAPV